MSAKLRELLLNEFNEDELSALSAGIGVNYAQLPGEGVFGKSRDLVSAARSRNKLYTLMARVRELRPDAFRESGLFAAIETDTAPNSRAGRATTNYATATPIGASPSTDSSPSRGVPERILRLVAVVGVAVLACLGLATVGMFVSGDATPGGIPTAAPPNLDSAATSVAIMNASAAVPPPTTAPLVTPPPAAPSSPGNVTAGQVNPTASAATPAAQAGTVVARPPPGVVPPATATLPPLAPAAQRVVEVNNQMVAYIAGRVDDTALSEYWTPLAMSGLQTFKQKLPRALGLPFPLPPDTVTADYTFLKPPTVESESPDKTVVTSRESWRYTNRRNNRTECETRDYTYTFANEAGKLRVATFEGRLLSTDCAQ